MGRSKSASYPERSVYLGEYRADVGSRLHCSYDGWLSREAAAPDKTIAESSELSGFKRNMVLFTRHNLSKKENVQPQEEKI